MKRCVPLIPFFLTTLFATPGFCRRSLRVGLERASTTLIFETSSRRGHLKQQGLDVKLITIRQSDVVIKATMAGDLNLMSVIPTAILASVRGLASGHVPDQRIDEPFIVQLLNPMHVPESQRI